MSNKTEKMDLKNGIVVKRVFQLFAIEIITTANYKNRDIAKCYAPA